MLTCCLWRAGRAALTDNFDACRDLSGRRLRHVNADKKLAEWAAQARERELEKVAAKHIRDQERAAQQEAEQQVRIHLQAAAKIMLPSCMVQTSCLSGPKELYACSNILHKQE